MKILVDENIPQGREVFSAYGTVATFHGRKLAAADVEDADALIVRSITKVDADLLDGSKVRFVGTATIGVDHIDQEYLRNRGIGFAAAPGCNARSVAEYFVAALLHLHAARALYPEGLDGKTLGIVGYGNVGRAVAAIAPALGLRVLLCDPPLAAMGEPAPAQAGDEFHALHEIAAKADIVTLHTPLTQSGPHPTFRMIDRNLFNAWDRPQVLMNMGRGEVVDESALLDALDAGKIRHLVLDVFPGEPRVNPELIRRAAIATPHIAGYSIQGKLNGTAQIHDAFREYFGVAKKSAVEYPVPEAPILDLEMETGLNAAVRQAYDITVDDAGLRAILGRPDFSTAFDGLRKSYPIRHEFAGFRVTGIPAEKKSQAEKLTRLGFSVD